MPSLHCVQASNSLRSDVQALGLQRSDAEVHEHCQVELVGTDNPTFGMMKDAVACSGVAGVYFLWAGVPEKILNSWGVTYYPSK